jgi:hypothetical protein
MNKDNAEVEYHAPIKIERLINKIKAISKDKGSEVVHPLYVY